MDARDRSWHEAYEEASPRIREAANEAFSAVKDTLASFGFRCAMDDSAEALVAQITRYIDLSGNKMRG